MVSSLLSSIASHPGYFRCFFLSLVFSYFSPSRRGKESRGYSSKVLSTFGLINKMEESRRSYGRLVEGDGGERIIEDRWEVSRTIESFRPSRPAFELIIIPDGGLRLRSSRSTGVNRIFPAIEHRFSRIQNLEISDLINSKPEITRSRV